ncbi:unnamed protein product [Periconia digitata]|uniref:Zn(2)-C6 fungal-type domain-containing protein n=1 Tax=Periconia digitata TaxID=1303443 RepID=A0A9W4UMI7_9PLEO|nr:unnamed protein product [Periconia digitata]
MAPYSMAERRTKTEPPPRKRALVSCDRCKLRRAKCDRPDGPEQPCLDCKSSDVVCESTLPRKKRVYGSVETLSLRFRALEALVKGLFPEENVTDTNTLFKIAASRTIAMPPADDYTPAEIFSHQRELPGVTTQDGTSFSYNSPDTSSSQRHNSLPDVTSSLATMERLFPVCPGVSLYFGPGSSFQLASVVRSLVARCQDIPEARLLLKRPTSRPLGSELDRSNFHLLKRSSSSVSEDTDDPSTTRATNISMPSKKRVKREVNSQEKKISFSRSTPCSFGEFLPPRPVADKLVSACFEVLMVVAIESSSFQGAYEATFNRRDHPIRPEHDTGWLCCLASVFLLGAQSLKRIDPVKYNTIEQQYMRFMWHNFRSLITTPKLANVQALVRLALHDLSAGKRNNTLTLISIAAQMAMSIGLHREELNAEFLAVEQSERKATWWYIYNTEICLSNILGRPSCIPEKETSMSFSDESWAEQGPLLPGMRHCIYRLTRLSNEVRTTAYPVGETRRECSSSDARRLLRQLDAWYASLPPHLQLESTLPMTHKRIVLLIIFNFLYMKCIVTRPFLIRKLENHIARWENPRDISEMTKDELALSDICIECAYTSLECLTAPESGLLDGPQCCDLSQVFHAVLILSLDFLARPKDHPDSLEDKRRKEMVEGILRTTPQIHIRSHHVMMGQIAFQFANIVGIIDDPPPPPPPLHATQTQLQTDTAPVTVDTSGSTSNIPGITKFSTGWFDSENFDMPWNSFEMPMQDLSNVMMATDGLGGFGDLEGDEVEGWGGVEGMMGGDSNDI